MQLLNVFCTLIQQREIVGLFTHIKGLFTRPAASWEEINAENVKVPILFSGYVVPMLLLGSIAIFIGYGFVGVESFLLKIKGTKWGLWFALRYLFSGTAVFFISVFIIDLLAPTFHSERSIPKTAQLVAYASTPSWLAALFLIYPSLGILGLIGLYGIYLFYTGLPVMKKTPEDKRTIYMLVCALILIILSWIMQFFIGTILSVFLGDPYALNAEDFRDLFRD